MTTKHIYTGITVQDETDLDVKCYVKAKFSLDQHYGTDADGNRGKPVWSMDELEITYPHGVDESDKQHLEREVEKQLWKKLEQSESNG